MLSILARWFFITHGIEGADVSKFREMGEAVMKGVNPYLVIEYNIYPPLGLYIEALNIILFRFLHLPFDIIHKIWPNVFDLLSAILIYKFLIKLNVTPYKSYFWTLLFFLNPISIIISAAHGQVDSIPSFFVLLSIYLLTFFKSQRTTLYAALCLSIAISIKPNPLMLLPLFLLFKVNLSQITKNVIKEKIIFLFVVILPVIISFIPYILDGGPRVIFGLFSYSGVYDIGYAGVMRGIFYQDNASIWLEQSEQLLQIGKVVFLVGMLGVLYRYLIDSDQLLKVCLLVYLLFFGVYFGLSVQYIVWILPLAVVLQDKRLIPFTISGLVTLVGFYLFFGPSILLGTLSSQTPYQSKYMIIYFVGNVILWSTTLWWLYDSFRKSKTS